MFSSMLQCDVCGVKALLACPLLAAAASAFLFRKSKWMAAALAILSAGFSLVLVFDLLLNSANISGVSFELYRLHDFSLRFGFLLDDISANMLFVAVFVGFLIHIFSVGYMKNDPAKGRFFAGLSFFMFSITGIALADNLFMMFVFWEFVGFSSYMLIAHYADTDFAKMASKKAFIVNRVGDFGFLIGIIWCHYSLGTTNFTELAELLKTKPELASDGIALFLMCGFLGKSAQFPLQVWLTDAMAGPTPVSALIHAATMVAAGVFMMVRLGVCGIMTPFSLDVLLLLGSAMAMFAGFWALGQRDIKKTLAYSTLAHLGIMAAAVGMGAYGLAMLHLTMHAFFKAALFLCAGSVIIGCHHEQDMFKMGGLWKKMPVTALVALVATLSIISIPYFAGYFSKESIVRLSFTQMIDSFKDAGQFADIIKNLSVFKLAIASMLFVAAILTPLYMGRFWFSVFGGKPLSKSASHAKESGVFMLLPLLVLGVLSLAGAYGAVYNWSWLGGKMAGLIPNYAQSFMAGAFEHYHKIMGNDMCVEMFGLNIDMFAATIIVCTLFMLVLAYLLYSKGKDEIEEYSPALYSALEKHGWFDDVYNYYVAKVQQRFAILLNALDLLVIQGICVKGSGLFMALIGGIFKDWHRAWVSKYIFCMLLAIVAMLVIFIY